MTLYSLKAENPSHPPSMRDLSYPTYPTPLQKTLAGYKREQYEA